MMKPYPRYFSTRLNSRLGISKMLHAGNFAASLEILAYHLVRLAIYVCLLVASFLLCQRMAAAGLSGVLPTLTYSLTNMISFALTMIGMNSILSCNEENEFMLSAPLSDFAYVADMLSQIYGRILATSLVLCLPAIITYSQNGNAHVGLCYWIIGFLLTGMPTGGIAALVGVFLALCLVKSPRKNQIQSLISILCIATVAVLAFVLLAKIGPYLATASADPAGAASQILQVTTGNSKFTMFYAHAILEQDPVYTLIFVFISLVWFVGFSLPITLGYRMMITSFACPIAYKAYAWQEQKSSPISRAIWKKEWKQLLLSKNYLVHVLAPLVVGLIVACGLCISKALSLGTYLSLKQVVALNCALIGAANATYCSYSIEGKYDWILLSAGISNRKSLAVKVGINLLFTLPYAIVSGLLLGLDAGAELAVGAGLTCPAMIAIGMLYALCNAWIGGAVDLRYGSHGAASEQQAMHQGLSYLLGYLPGIVIPLVVCLLL